jgi:hypothetical protein
LFVCLFVVVVFLKCFLIRIDHRFSIPTHRPGQAVLPPLHSPHQFRLEKLERNLTFRALGSC